MTTNQESNLLNKLEALSDMAQPIQITSPKSGISRFWDAFGNSSKANFLRITKNENKNRFEVEYFKENGSSSDWIRADFRLEDGKRNTPKTLQPGLYSAAFYKVDGRRIEANPQNRQLENIFSQIENHIEKAYACHFEIKQSSKPNVKSQLTGTEGYS